ncbi:MAG: hypothetical protein CMO61_02550 [Verrucomicrobiales bacterium]|jgi:hypothetical protein|nr:hypothetical protein [Verrucomicrobiales bacterium]|tara:strand:+ start:23010 stop:23855 length:846 start_codon:yes stop_codon:yes gene_type:complete
MDRLSFLAFAAAFPAILSAQNVVPDFDHAPFHVLTIEEHSENENLEFKIRAAVFARIPGHDSLLVEKIEFAKEFREPIQLISPFDPIADSSAISLTKEGVEGNLILDTRDGWTSFSLRTKSDTAAGDLLGMLKFDGKTRNGETFSFRLMNLRGGETRPDTGEKDLAKSAMFLEHGAFEAAGDPEKTIRFSPSGKALDLNAPAISGGFKPGCVGWNLVKNQPHQIRLSREGGGTPSLIQLLYTPGGEELPADFPDRDDWTEATMIYFKLDGLWFHNSGSMMF